MQHVYRIPTQKYTILALHLHISLLAKILQQVTSFEVLVGVDNCLELVGRHNTLVLGLFDLCLVQVFKYPGQSKLALYNNNKEDFVVGTTYRLHAMWNFWLSLSSLTPCITDRSDTPMACTKAFRLSKLKCRYGQP